MNRGLAAKSLKTGIKDFSTKNAIIIAFIVLVVVMSITKPDHFLTVSNLVNILKQSSVLGILTIGMTFVLLTGGIDLSVGSVLAVSGVCGAFFAAPGGIAQTLGGMNQSTAGNGQALPLVVPIVAALVVGLAFGLLNGAITAKGKVPSFIVTMGTMTIARGAALLITGGGNFPYLTDEFKSVGKDGIFGIQLIPLMVIIFVASIILAAFVLKNTKFGRYIYAVGGNEMAARVSGIGVEKIQIAVYGISGICAGLAGFLLASRTAVGSPVAGEGYELDAIAACVLGGTSLTGGIGKVWGSIIGVLFMGVMNNGLDMLGVNSYWQSIIKGIIIVLAVLFDQISIRKANKDKG